MARYIDADELIRLLEIDAVCQGDHFTKRDAIRCVKAINTADVAPKSEVVTKTLSDIKRQIHEKAIYPHNAGIKPYISVREVDAIIQDALKKTEVKV